MTERNYQNLDKLLLKETRHVDWLVSIFEKGGHTTTLSADELAQVVDAIELSKVKDEVKRAMESNRFSSIFMAVNF